MPSAAPAEPITEMGSPSSERKRAHKDGNDSERRHKKAKSGKSSKKAQGEKTATSASQPTPKKTSFPFFTQTISLWVPLYPIGFDRPVSSAGEQHLSNLLNHYSPLLGGYLLAYHNVNLSESAVRADPNNPPTDETPATLASIDEYAVGFAWMTADVDLFVPSRGAFLEGKVILQNEGSIGVNCWDKFNASIEAARLPQGWKYVEVDNDFVIEDEPQITGSDGEKDNNETTDQSDALATSQLHPTGHWVDENGELVSGNLLFRIKDFDVGLAGDNGYLAIEGTMLSPKDELLLLRKEKEKARSTARGKTRRLPEFSITQFGREDEEETSEERVEVYKASRPGTPDD